MRISNIDLKRVMIKVKDVGGIVTHHAENGEMLDRALKEIVKAGDLSLIKHRQAHPVEAEVDAIKTLVKLSKETNCPIYIVHLSSKEGLAEVIKAKRDGVKLFVESCPQYLAYNDEVYQNSDFSFSSKFILSPPLRDKASNEALWNGFISGDIDVLATDHCPFTLEQRMIGKKDFRLIPNGMRGVETRMEYFYNEGVRNRGLSIERYVQIISTTPAKIFGLYPNKGTIKVGSDADILILKKDSKFKVDVYHYNDNKGQYISRTLPTTSFNW
jgi:dihydropyrimidinase